MISHLDRFLLAFRRDVLRARPHEPDHYARLYWQDRTAFHESMAQSWKSGLPEPFVSMALVASQNEDIGAKGARRLARRLIDVGRFAEADAVLRDERYRLDEEGGDLLELASAQLGLGRLARATATAAEGAARDPRLADAAARIDAAVAGIRAAQDAALASRAWAEARLLFDRWIEIGASEDALRVLTDVLTRGVRLEQSDVRSFHEALDIVLSLHRPVSAYSLFRALDRLCVTAKQRYDLGQICEGLDRETPAALASPIQWLSARTELRTSGALAWAAEGRIAPAIDALGSATVQRPKAADPRAALARLIGQDVLERFPLRLAPPGQRKVFDVFPFNDELRMLRLKLSEMAAWVDYFVLVEARETFTGAAKPLVFQENRSSFAAFESKIVHVVVDSFPSHVRHPWSREFYQRDMGVQGLNGLCAEDDLVLISDADEVISPSTVLGFEGEYARLGMERARFFLNYREALTPAQQKDASTVWRARYLRSIGLSNARNTLRWNKRAPRLANGGWHFTSMADAPGIAAKLSNSAHQEHVASAETIGARLARLRAGELEPGWERCELDERFPAFVLSHRNEFEDLLL